MKVFNSIGHFFAWLAGILSTGAADAAKLAAVAPDVATAIASIAGKDATGTAAKVQAIAGSVVASFLAAGSAVASDGLNVALDSAALAALEALAGEIKAAFAGQSVPVASAPVQQAIIPAGAAK